VILQKHFLLLTFITSLACSALTGIETNSVFRSDNFILNTEIQVYQLSSPRIIAHTEVVHADTTLLAPLVDYILDYKSGTLHLIHGSSASFLHVEYIVAPDLLNKAYFMYEPSALTDSLDITKKRFKLLIPDDSKLNISGSKTFAITFSDNEAFDLKQSLFLNLMGELAPGVNITAQLSDSQSKLSPEGDSKELSSLDQVYIKIFGKHYEIAMGDLDWSFSGTNYINYKTKFEGINLWYQDQHAVQAAYSANNGKRASMKVEVVEGKQGPYYLSAGSYQQNFLIVAGSELIYIDGSEAERGSDYSIDYSEGSITFKRIVTPNNDVTAYFQYSDEYYKQNMFFNSSQLRFFDKLTLSHHFIYQADDSKNPLLYDFSPADKDSLHIAGDSEVLGNGVFISDSGSYKLLQTTEGISYYEYSEHDSTAIYTVIFSYVGYQNGEYEEFATGKYRYVGMGFGSWIPGKRLIAPVIRTNIDSRLDYTTDTFQSGVEMLYSLNDNNTLSDRDDNDNSGLLLYAFAKLQPSWDRFSPEISLDHETRSDNLYFFTDIAKTDYDFASLISADSLAQNQTNLKLKFEISKFWSPDVLLRYKSIPGLYDQRALRFVSRSKAWFIVPEINLQSTISEQDSPDSTGLASVLNYHNIVSTWEYHSVLAKIDALFNSMEYKGSAAFSTRYKRLNPAIILGNRKKSYTGLYYTTDQNDVKQLEWQKVSSSDTYAVKNSISSENNTLILDATHREIRNFKSTDNPKSRYDLINLRSSSNFLNNAASLLGNYQLNQTEFYPKIRELQYIGSGIGVYDSTGVYTTNGDFDYVYITSETGTLSAEINGQVNLYLKPGQLSQRPLWQKFQTDLMIQSTELSADRDNYKKYFFLPGSVFNSTSTLYGKQAFQQTLWMDLYTNRLTGNLQYEINRSLDKRYQDVSRTFSSLRSAEFQYRNFRQANLRLRLENNIETDSRYQSEISTNKIGIQIMRNFNTQTSAQIDCDTSFENGEQANDTGNYSIRSIALKPAIRSVWMQKYRVASSVTLQYNDRSGTDYLSFLPNKREGFISIWNLQAIYRLNSFSSASLEYSGKSYPGDRTTHQLKMEFKAEL
jgi:hypothetical protein